MSFLLTHFDYVAGALVLYYIGLIIYFSIDVLRGTRVNA
jgi:hypothetical protein